MPSGQPSLKGKIIWITLNESVRAYGWIESVQIQILEKLWCKHCAIKHILSMADTILLIFREKKIYLLKTLSSIVMAQHN